MKTTVQKWGNSLALRIPNAFAAEMDLRPGVAVSLSVDGGALVVRRTHREYSLPELLPKVTTDNIHREELAAKPAGKEVW